MRSLFDQYSVPENRVTHALACCLAEEPRLLRRFVVWATDRPAPKGQRLRVVQQQVPGEPQIDEEEGERRGLPDAWIFGDSPWSLIIESKVAAPVGSDQLRRHLRIAQRHGFDAATLLVLSPAQPRGLPPGVVHRRWSEVYCWANREAGRGSVWARRLAEYLEVAETKMVSDEYLREGTLTMFNGFPFDDEHPYSYGEAKRLLNMAMDALRARADLRRLGMNPEGPGRPAITGREAAAVWDFLPLKAAGRERQFTRHPHLTLAVHRDHLEVFVTVPHSSRPQYRRALLEGGPDGFRQVIQQLCAGLRPVLRLVPEASPRLYALQRHYLSQNSAPIDDARLDFDPRTSLPSGEKRVKAQPQWVNAVYESLLHKRSNIQLGAGVRFPYTAQRVRTPQVLDLIAGGWIGCRPLLKAMGAC